MLARWWTFGVWALVAGSALFWGLRLFVQAPAAPRETVVAQASAGVRSDLTRLFGADAPPPVVAEAPQAAPDARFQLIGVVSPRGQSAGREGLALIAVDGKPARAYRVGSAVTGDTVLQSVGQRGATLGPRGGAGQVALELAPLPAAATGTLPSIGGDGDAAPPALPLRKIPGMPGAGMQQGGPMPNGDMAPPISPQQQAETMQIR